LTFLGVLIGSGSLGQFLDAGKQASENSLVPVDIAAPERLGGLPGLAAPQPTLANAAIGVPGLQAGRPAGLSPGSNFNNIFIQRVNLLDRGCRDLAGAGFFNHNPALCRDSLRR